MSAHMRAGLEELSWFVNRFFFPLGAGISILLPLTLMRAVHIVFNGYAANHRFANRAITSEIDGDSGNDFLFCGQ